MANYQDLDIYAGETRTLTLYARTPENAVLDLSAISSIAWFVSYPLWTPDQMSPVLQKVGTITDAALGKFTVTVYPFDTVPLEGNYNHLAMTTTDGTLEWVNNSEQEIVFQTDEGNDILWVSNYDEAQTVVVSGTLHIRRSVLQY